MNTPVRLPRMPSVGSPARSKASQVASSSRRCCGSIPSASRRADPEQLRIEFTRLIKKPTLPHIRRPSMIRIRMIQTRQIPAPIGGEQPDPVLARGQQTPEFFRRSHPAWIAARHRHDRDRLVVALLDLAQAFLGLVQLGGDPLEEVAEFFLVRHLRSTFQEDVRRDIELRKCRIAFRAGRTFRRQWRCRVPEPGCRPGLDRRSASWPARSAAGR